MDNRTVHLGVYDTLADWEYGYATAQINTPDFQRHPGLYRVVTVGETTEPITTTGGVRIVPDMAVADLHPQDSSMLILPGARAWDSGELKPMARAARQFLDHAVPVAAICGATLGLAREGLLDHRAHTSSAAQYLAASGYQGGDHYVDRPVVTDGALITAGPQSAVDFAYAIFTTLELYEQDVLDAWYTLYRHQDLGPFMAMMSAGSS